MEPKQSFLNTRSDFKIFTAPPKDFYLNPSQPLLFSCLLLQTGTLKKKIWFLRIYEDFMIVSSDQLFNKFKIAFFSFDFTASFPVSELFPENSTRFQLVKIDYELEFTTVSHEICEQLERVLQTKVNLGGFHNKFKCIKQIGKGNFANVYLIADKNKGTLHAAKAICKNELAKQKIGKEALLNEIEVLRSIQHPNIISLEAVYETNNSYYMIFELCSGGNLKDYIQEQKVVAESKAAAITRDILEGIKALHQKNIMHRDIKPENILFRSKASTSKDIDENNQILIADFGLATYNTKSTNYLYEKCGTPGFVAPEIFACEPNTHYDVKCDLFSVGMTLFYMLTGIIPLPNSPDLLQQNRDFDYDLTKFKSFTHLSKKAQNLLSKLLCPVNERFSVFQALNHPFITESPCSPSSNEDSECDDLTLGSEDSLASFNLNEFNKRNNLCLTSKNLMLLTHSPIITKTREKNDLGGNEENSNHFFVSFPPLINGFINTVSCLTEETTMNQGNSKFLKTL